MKYLLDLIIQEISNDHKFESIDIKDSSLREYERDVYIDGDIYKEYKVDVVCTVDTGLWYGETIRFEIVCNSGDMNLKVKKGYGDDYLVWKKSDFKKVATYIVEEIFQFRYKNKKIVKIHKNII